MNDAIQPLERDRIRILQALEALEQYADQLLTSTPPDEAVMRDFGRFFRHFGDIHFATKVDEILLPDLVRCEAGLDMDVVSQIRAAHELQQYHLRTMEQYVDSLTEHDDDSRRSLHSRIHAFIESQRQVCQTLAAEVFPLVAGMTPDERDSLRIELDQFDRASIGQSERAHLSELFERLVGADVAAGAPISSRASGGLRGDSEPHQATMITE